MKIPTIKSQTHGIELGIFCHEKHKDNPNNQNANAWYRIGNMLSWKTQRQYQQSNRKRMVSNCESFVIKNTLTIPTIKSQTHGIELGIFCREKHRAPSTRLVHRPFNTAGAQAIRHGWCAGPLTRLVRRRMAWATLSSFWCNLVSVQKTRQSLGPRNVVWNFAEFSEHDCIQMMIMLPKSVGDSSKFMD